VKFKNYDPNNNYASTLLTGDVSLNQINNSLYIKSNQENICVFQVPHHGSAKGWDTAYLGIFSNRSTTDAIINFGYGNHYGHPKSLVLESLMDNNLAPYFCTQFEECEYEFELSFP